MATPSNKLIQALKRTLIRLSSGDSYQWGHMGNCNCGHLAQELTQLSAADIHAYALRSRSGDWTEQVMEYCPSSNLPMDLLIAAMLDAGLTVADIRHIERLSDPKILHLLPGGHRYLQQNKKEDVIAYFETLLSYWEKQVKPSKSNLTYSTTTDSYPSFMLA